MALRDDFWSNCEWSAGEDACWNWLRGTNNHGYGMLRDEELRSIYAHRHAYQLTKGPIPDGLVVMHRCDNRRCVNPAHLSIGTVGENNADRDEKHMATRGTPYNCGLYHGGAKLTPDKVIKIRAMLAQKIPQAKIAKEFSCGATTIHSIATGRRWGWLADPIGPRSP